MTVSKNEKKSRSRKKEKRGGEKTRCAPPLDAGVPRSRVKKAERRAPAGLAARARPSRQRIDAPDGFVEGRLRERVRVVGVAQREQLVLLGAPLRQRIDAPDGFVECHLRERAAVVRVPQRE